MDATDVFQKLPKVLVQLSAFEVVVPTQEASADAGGQRIRPNGWVLSDDLDVAIALVVVGHEWSCRGVVPASLVCAMRKTRCAFWTAPAFAQ